MCHVFIVWVNFEEVSMIDYDGIAECVALISTGIISPYTYPRLDTAFGSGFFIDSQLVVTCKHVIKDANKAYFKTTIKCRFCRSVS